MPRILKKRELAPKIKEYEVESPLVAEKARPGNFVIIRLHEQGERIPLTIADSDPEQGTIKLVVQEVGKTTLELGTYSEGDEILDLAGPLGRETQIEKADRIIGVAGGVGTAPLYPILKGHREVGNEIITLIGAQTEEMLILREEMEAVSDQVHYSTDDGSFGYSGFVTELLDETIQRLDEKVDEVIVIGPAIMMKVACDVTRKYGIKTTVSLNAIMVDGTGMCGGCRVTVDGESKFSCVEGPEFDGHAVDFDELLTRQGRFVENEEKALEVFEKRGDHRCRLENV